MSLCDDVMDLSDRETVCHVERKESVLTTNMMNLAAFVHSLRCSLLHIESRLLQASGLTLDKQLGEFTAGVQDDI